MTLPVTIIMRSAATLLVFCTVVSSLQWQQWLTPWFNTAQPGQLVLDADDLPVHRIPRIAIIGAGPAGSSAAYWLSLAKERANLTFEVDLYERSGSIGGSTSALPVAHQIRDPLNTCLPGTTVVHPYGNAELGHVELGGSIFVDDNRYVSLFSTTTAPQFSHPPSNLMRATELFNLERVNSDFNHSRDFGIWDGQQFVFRVSADLDSTSDTRSD